MKKIVFISFLFTFILVSCWAEKFENLPSEKQDEISKTILEKREKLISEIDMSAYSSEANLTEENIAKLTSQIKEINKKVLDEVKEKENWVDLSLIEDRLNKIDVKSEIKK